MTIQTKHAVVLLSNITINSGLEVALVEVLKPMANNFKLTWGHRCTYLISVAGFDKGR